MSLPLTTYVNSINSKHENYDLCLNREKARHRDPICKELQPRGNVISCVSFRFTCCCCCIVYHDYTTGSQLGFHESLRRCTRQRGHVSGAVNERELFYLANQVLAAFVCLFFDVVVLSLSLSLFWCKDQFLRRDSHFSLQSCYSF